MGQDDALGTATLARLFAAQGHWEKAADIYRSLLRQDPGRQDLTQALDEAQAAMRAAGSTSSRTLAPLVQKWIELLLAYDRLRTLQRFKRRL